MISELGLLCSCNLGQIFQWNLCIFKLPNGDSFQNWPFWLLIWAWFKMVVHYCSSLLYPIKLLLAEQRPEQWSFEGCGFCLYGMPFRVAFILNRPCCLVTVHLEKYWNSTLCWYFIINLHILDSQNNPACCYYSAVYTIPVPCKIEYSNADFLLWKLVTVKCMPN